MDGWKVVHIVVVGIHAFAMIRAHTLYLLRLGRVDGWMHRNPLTDAHVRKGGNENNSNICIHIYMK